jgi:hypothetical protein
VSAVGGRVLPSPRRELDERPEIDDAGAVEQVLGRVDDVRGVRRDDGIGEVLPSVETQEVPEVMNGLPECANCPVLDQPALESDCPELSAPPERLELVQRLGQPAR